jgi:hypothetical protein
MNLHYKNGYLWYDLKPKIMNIQGLAPLSATHNDIRITDITTNEDNFTLSSGGTIREIDRNLNFIITIFVNIEINETGKNILLETEHKYEVKLGERNIKFTSESDFWDMASLMQVSISHARIFLMQQLNKHSIEKKLLRLDPLQNIYEQVKNGYFALWN